jgi:hypothetical protein
MVGTPATALMMERQFEMQPIETYFFEGIIMDEIK